jgi:hypothetical protein
MDDLKRITQLIEKWSLNKAFLAKKLGMLRGTFNNKIKPDHYTKFSEQEVEKLKGILIKMREDLKDL